MSFIGDLIDSFLEWLKSLFWKQEMELTLIGLKNSGKTTLVNVIATGQYNEDMIPTVGFNMKKVVKGNVSIKLWDLGGQPRFRSMWERYCRGVNAIVFVMDAADSDKFEPAKKELQDLLTKPILQGIPLLILGNKNDLPNCIGVEDMVTVLDMTKFKIEMLDTIQFLLKPMLTLTKYLTGSSSMLPRSNWCK